MWESEESPSVPPKDRIMPRNVTGILIVVILVLLVIFLIQQVG